MSKFTTSGDIISSLQNWRFWLRFAWQDVVNANIRTRLGLLLYPILSGIWIVTIAVLFGDLLGGGREDFMAYVGIGYVVFTFVNGCITASYNVFKRNVKIIQNMPIAIMNFPLRETTRFFLQMLLQSTTVILVLVLLKIPITPMAIWVLPGLLFLCVFGLSLTLLFAIIGAYLPDLAAFTSSFMRLFFFITPIWWYPGERGGTRALIADLNPLTHCIRLFRYPLLENSPPSNLTLIICALSLLVTASASLMLFAATRRYILLRL